MSTQQPFAETNPQPAPLIELLPLADIHLSRNNPRKHFDEPALDELAVSIREKGILEPLIVRQMIDLVPRGPMKGAHEYYELVAGERRLRAAEKAGLESVPCRIMELTDQQAAEIRIIENVQRADLSPLEQAHGYRELIDKYKYTAEDVAQKIGKSVATVYGLLKLVLLPEKAKKAVEAGTLAPATATLIGRIPSDKLRKEATKVVLDGDWNSNGNPLGYRQAQEQIKRHFMIELKQAPFSTKDPELTSAGACTDCPKCTGNNRAEYPDGRADICTDPGCYADKVKAHQQRLVERAEADGKKVLTGKKAQEIFPPHTTGVLPYQTSWVDLAGTCHDLPGKSKGWQTLVGKELAEEIVLVQDNEGAIHQLVPKKRAYEVLKEKHGVGRNGTAGHGGLSAEEKKRRLKAKEENEIKLAVLAKAAASAEKLFGCLEMSFSAKSLVAVLRSMCRSAIDSAWGERRDTICRRRGAKGKLSTDRINALKSLLVPMDARQLMGFLVEFHIVGCHAAYSGGKCSDEIQDLRIALGLDRKAIEQQVKAEESKPKPKPVKPLIEMRPDELKETCAKADTPELRERLRSLSGTDEWPALEIADLGITVLDVENAYVSQKLGSKRLTSAISARPVQFDGRAWVNVGGSYNGNGETIYNLAPLYAAENFERQFLQYPTRFQPDGHPADDDARREFYTGVVVKVRGKEFAIAPSCEERKVRYFDATLAGAADKAREANAKRQPKNARKVPAGAGT